jgi:UDP-N-acetylglucosamine diphosphorylase/glucosamine-1-phosphate N-acetyltransferase
MDAKIYGGTTIGPHCKVGGELNNVVFFGYSNKAHDGFMGHSVVGEWCNLGADTNTSNLKNTYDSVRLWSYVEESFVSTGLQFCGLMFGDHSKCGINTMFNTGTVVGVSCNIYGSGYQRNFIPSFNWGGTQGFQTFKLNRAFKVAEAMMARRGIEFDKVEKDILAYIFEETSGRRHR